MNEANTPAPKRRSLTDVLTNGQRDAFFVGLETAQVAADLVPIPSGRYVAHLVRGELFNARTTGTPGFKLTFKILEGQHAGRLVWDDLWMTPAARPQTLRALKKLGLPIHDPTKLEECLNRPLPPGIRCELKVTVRKGDDGADYNRVRSFEVIGVDPDPTADPDFAPTPQTTPAPVAGGDAEPSLLPPTDPPSALEGGL